MGGNKESISARHNSFSMCVSKGEKEKIQPKIQINESIHAPIKKGEVIGKVSFLLDGKEIGYTEIYSTEDIERIKFGEIFKRMFVSASGF